MRLKGKWTGYKYPTALADGCLFFSHARPVFGFTFLLFFLQSDALTSIVLRTMREPLGTGRQPLNAVGRDSFFHSPIFLLLVPLFPMRRLFLALPAILLSPKRCSCVNPCYARMREPLWTRYKHLPIYWLSAPSALSAFTHASQIANGAV